MQFEDPRSILEAAAATPTRAIDPYHLLKRGARARRLRFASAVAGLAIVVAGASMSSGWVGGGDGPGPAGDDMSRCEDGVTSVVVYIDDSSARREIGALRIELEGNPAVRRVEYVSRKEALEEFGELAGVSEELDSFEAPPPGAVPASFRVEAADEAAAKKLLYLTGPAVEEVRLWPREEDFACLERSFCALPLSLEASVFLRDGASRAEIAELRESLLAMAGVREANFFSKKEAYEEFRLLYEDKPELYETISPGDLPASVRVRTTTEAAVERLGELSHPIIDEVRSSAGLREHLCEKFPVPGPNVDVGKEAAEPRDPEPPDVGLDARYLSGECGIGPMYVSPTQVVDEPGSKWCRFEVLVRNLGPRPVRFVYETQRLRTTGVPVRPYPLKGTAPPGSGRLFEGVLDPGQEARGRLVFVLDHLRVPTRLEVRALPPSPPVVFLLRTERCRPDPADEPHGRCSFGASEERVGIHPQDGPVNVTLYHCGVDPVEFAGEVWVALDPPFDATNAPEGFVGRGTMKTRSDIEAVYVDASGVRIELQAVDAYEPPTCD